MANWKIAVGIVVFAIYVNIVALRLCDRVTRLEALVELLEKEIIAIRKKMKDGEQNENN